MNSNEVEKAFIEPYDFLYYFSPTLPYNFPPERVPKNLCEVQLLSVIKCYSDHPTKSEDMKRGPDCHKFASEFNQCKRRRDLHMYHEIEEWETKNFSGLKQENRSIYIKNLNEEKQALEKKFDAIPASEGSVEKRWRIYSDLLQTRWRINYLERLVKN